MCEGGGDDVCVREKEGKERNRERDVFILLLSLLRA